MSATDSNITSNELHNAASLLCELIRRPSVTPSDGGCQKLIAERLANAGFACETMQFGEVTNLWARTGTNGPLLCFAGHTDVVPVGNLDDWSTDPFEPVIRDGMIFGRGAVDMKGGLAAMIVAAEEFLQANNDIKGSLAFLITSDEEGAAENGTRRVIEELQARGENIDRCVIGEPSSSSIPGDVIRIGRRGSLSGRLVVRGIQGHVAYPDLADNPNHKMANILAELHSANWGEGDQHFPATSIQIVSLESGIGVANVIPSEARAEFNFRYSPAWNYRTLQDTVEAIVAPHAGVFEIEWDLFGEPFLTTESGLIGAAVQVLADTNGAEPDLSTGGGTSDGRFIRPAGAEVVELGLTNATAHKANECTKIDHIELLCTQYRKILERLLLS